MKALVWNCQAVGSPLMVLQLKEEVNLLFPNLIILLETKNKKVYLEKVKKKEAGF